MRALARRLWQKRFCRFIAVTGFTAALGSLVLATEVSAFGWPPKWAWLPQAFIVFLVNFALNWRVTWKKEPTKRQSRRRWFVVQSLLLPCGFFLYNELKDYNLEIPRLGLDYLVAKTLVGIVLLIPGYLMAKLWAFAVADKKTTLA